MNFIHSGLAVSNEENADRFFIDILGLEKSTPKILNGNLSKEIFGIDTELLMMHYRKENVDYEVLVYKEYRAPDKQIAHSCLQVSDLKNIVSKCKEAGLKVIEVPKGEVILTFISDYDGNLFEMKE